MGLETRVRKLRTRLKDVSRKMAKGAAWMIGLSFKTGTDDLRESPLALIAEQFMAKG